MPIEQSIKPAELRSFESNEQTTELLTLGQSETSIAPSALSFPAVFELSDLDGTNGFAIVERGGGTVSGAGDINGDGFDDVIRGDRANGSGHVVFGAAGEFPAAVSTYDLDGYFGFEIAGRGYGSETARSVSDAGDVNGDGFDDFIVGARRALGEYVYGDRTGFYKNSLGQSYVVFGTSDGFPGNVSLRSLDGNDGFTVSGLEDGDELGTSVSGAGDVNGDGFDDVILGADGKAYVIFGPIDSGLAEFNLSDLDGSNGFSLIGGGEVSDAGDINGDGYDDVLFGPNVVFGRAAGFSVELDIGTLDGSNGFSLMNGGSLVSGAGDFNGDGFADILVGANLVFGGEDSFPALFDLANLNGSNGLAFDSAFDISDVSGAGDVNGDGFDDIIMGAGYATFPNVGRYYSGQSYVVFGGSGGFPERLQLATLDGRNGFAINGGSDLVQAGYSVSGAGDVNGDGFDDVIIGDGPLLYSEIFEGASSYVIFGAPTETPPPPVEDVLFRINTGGTTVASTDGGPDWSADTAAVNSPYLVDAANNKVVDYIDIPPSTPLPSGVPSEVFESQRAAAPWSSDMAWAFDVPDAGRYQVNLFLREWWTGASDPGDRVFDVAVEGNVPAAFDDIDAAGDFGFRNGGVVSSTVEVTDGTLDLAFLSETRNPMVNAIEIVALDAPPPPPEVLFRVNAGGETVAAEDGGPDWSADTATANSPFLVDAANNKVTDELVFNPTTTPLPEGVPPALFESQRAAAPWSSDMAWAFDVPDAGFYEVNLFLREFWNSASDPGDRVFDVAVEGQVPAAFDDIDPAGDFGFRNGGVVSTTVEVTDGTLDLTFLSEVGNPMVNAIEIVALDATMVDDFVF